MPPRPRRFLVWGVIFAALAFTVDQATKAAALAAASLLAPPAAERTALAQTAPARPAVSPEARDAARAAGNPKPVAAFLVPQADQSLRLLAEAGIAAFRTPEASDNLIGAALDHCRRIARTGG